MMKSMIKSLTVLVITITAITVMSQTKSEPTLTKENFYFDADNIAYYLEGARLGIIPFNPSIPVKPAEFRSSMIQSGKVIEDSPDIVVIDDTDITQSENSVFVDPNDNQHILNSNNSTDWDGSSVNNLYGANYLRSYNGGISWSGSTAGAGGENKGDPAAAITNTGRRYIGYINSDRGQGVSYSTDGITWTAVDITGAYSFPNLMDKNHLMVDNTPGGFYEGNVYSAWTHLDYSTPEPDNHREIEFAWSTNNGVSWSTHDNISDGVSAGYMCQGANIQIGPSGQVYVCFCIYDNSSSKGPHDETAIGFTESLNGGSTFSTAIRAIDNIKGIRYSGVSKNMRMNSFPSMAVDVSGGSFDGNIYIVWANRGTPGINSGTNISVYMIRSTDGGTTWSSAIKVNQGAFTDGKEAYIPWITCDPTTGNLFCIFYDDRNTASSDVETWVAYSTDGGDTWEDFAVSDVSFTPQGIPGLAVDYFGDYLGITARDNFVYPCWTDNRSGAALTYVSPFYFDEHCYASATNLNFEYISYVNVGSINNSSGSNGYSDYTSLSTDIPLNGDEDISVGNGYGGSSNQCAIWIDYNRNGSFEDPGESITVSGSPGGGPYTANIDPPSGATTGECVMRIRITYDSTPEPCGVTTYGEVEDYTINITPEAPNVWTGNVNNYWGNSGNWSLGHIPTALEEVTIADVNMPCIVDFSDKTCYDIIVEAGATVEILDQALNVMNNAYIYGAMDLLNTASRLNIEKDIKWYAGSTGSMIASATIKVNEDWDFKDGANVQFNAGYVEFIGTSTSWWRSYEENCSIYHLRSNKSSGGELRVSPLSTRDLHISGNIYNYSGAIFRSQSNYSIILDGFMNNMNGHFYMDNGTFVYNGNASAVDLKPNTGDYFNNLMIDVTSSLSLDNTYSGDLVVNEDIIIQGGSLNANAFNIKIGDDWTNSGGTFNPGTSTVIFESLGDFQDIYGTETFYDILQVNTGHYLRFNGATTINHDLELHYKCWAYNTFTVNGTLNLNDPNSQFTANSSSANSTVAALDQGGKILCNGNATLTVNDLVEDGLYGTIELTSGTFNIYQPDDLADLNGSLTITDGQMNIYGPGFSWWPFKADASITMSGGVLDMHTLGITINNSATYTLVNNITGGVIRTASGFQGYRSDFTPTAGSLEFYGSGDAYIYQSNGSTLNNVIVDKESTDNTIPVGYTVKPDKRNKVYPENGSKDNTIRLSTDFTITGNLTINSGNLELDGNELTVNHDCSVYGTLTMDDPADILNVGINYFDNLAFYSGSTANLTEGVANIYGWIVPNTGSNFALGLNNTVVFRGVNGGGPTNHEPSATYGNIEIQKNTGNNTYVSGSATQPIVVNGDLIMHSGNIFELQNESVIIHGALSDVTDSEILIYDSGKQGDPAIYSSENTNSTPIDKPAINTYPSKNGIKSGYLEVDNDFMLYGLLDVGDGSTIFHGNFNMASSGTMNINGGSVVADQPYAKDTFTAEDNSQGNSKAWQYLNGTINMTDGLFEISYNSIQFSSTSVNNISGGTIRCGFTFSATEPNCFQPNGGSVEFIGANTTPFISLGNSAGNYFYNLTINRSASIVLVSDIKVKNDFLLENGQLNTDYSSTQYDMYVGGDWTNNSGEAAFVESTGKVYFDGPNKAYVLSDETFYDVELNKTYSNFDGLELNNGKNVSILNNLNISDGTFELNSNSSLSVNNNLIIATGAGLNAGGSDTGIEVYIGGDWINYNSEYNTIVGYTPGGEIITFNGSGDQVISTLAPQEDFGHLIINKPGTKFRSNNNIRVINDFEMPSGIWHDNTVDLTHYFEGDFTIASGSIAYWISSTGNTVVFKGLSDQFVSNPFGTGYFQNMIIDKTAWSKKNNKAIEGAEISSEVKSTIKNEDLPEKSGSGSKSSTVFLASTIDMEYGSGLTVEEGVLDLNGYALFTMGTIDINDGGKIVVSPSSTLKIEEGDILNVNTGGIIDIIGSTGSPATITRRSITGSYGFNVNSGGQIGADWAIFEYMNGNGIFLKEGSLVDAVNTFNNTVFRYGHAAPSALFTVNNSAVFTSSNTTFENSFGTTGYNVSKFFDSGEVIFTNPSGDFAGPEYEYDNHDLIQWSGMNVELDLKVMMEGPFDGAAMITEINSLLPYNQPFNVTLPYYGGTPDWYYTGSESVSIIPNIDIVDWILVEIRDATSPSSATPITVTGRKALFLLSDGSVVDLDGSSNPVFSIDYSNQLYTVIWNRNHVGILSAFPLERNGIIYMYDFTSGSDRVYGDLNGHTYLGGGIYGMMSGEASGDGDINITDLENVWQTLAGQGSSYAPADFNYDGEVDNRDKNDYWLPNNGNGSFIPE